MLHDYVKLEPGDWVLQNGANSVVGFAVIQMCKALGFRTANVIRDRSGVEELKASMTALGADKVYVEAELRDGEVRDWLSEQAKVKLGFNCVGGPATTDLARCLAHDATLVTYGAMAKQPVSLPATLFIFRDLKAVGFWMTNWYRVATPSELAGMFKVLSDWIHDGKLKLPPVEEVQWNALSDDTAATKMVQQALEKAMSDFKGVKMVWKME